MHTLAMPPSAILRIYQLITYNKVLNKKFMWLYCMLVFRKIQLIQNLRNKKEIEMRAHVRVVKEKTSSSATRPIIK